jgi:hypothetical protein
MYSQKPVVLQPVGHLPVIGRQSVFLLQVIMTGAAVVMTGLAVAMTGLAVAMTGLAVVMAGLAVMTGFGVVGVGLP